MDVAAVEFRHYYTTCLIDVGEVTKYILVEVQTGDLLSTIPIQTGSHRVRTGAI